jgi:NTP pyrophosphatase (non-canonical NTP hydrolase)
MPIEEVTFHFTEEVGEVAEQIRESRALEMITSKKIKDKKRKEKIVTEFKKELADVFSWYSGILIIIK